MNGVNRLLVRAARIYELFFGRFADVHLTVSEAMKRNLGGLSPGIRAKPIYVLYDRATSKFKQTDLKTKQILYQSVSLKD